MPLLVVVVVAIAGFTVYRIHGVFGSDTQITSAGAGLANDAKPFNPKRVTYGAMIRTCGWFSAGGREWAHLPGNDLKVHSSDQDRR